jgi:hypothetical protein
VQEHLDTVKMQKNNGFRCFKADHGTVSITTTPDKVMKVVFEDMLTSRNTILLPLLPTNF